MKTKKLKSAYASGAPACAVSIQGAKKSLNKAEIQSEYNGLLISLAAILESNDGRVAISYDALNAVVEKKRVLQIVPAEFGVYLQFENTEEAQETPEVEEGFLKSSVAQEARDYLNKQKENNETI